MFTTYFFMFFIYFIFLYLFIYIYSFIINIFFIFIYLYLLIFIYLVFIYLYQICGTGSSVGKATELRALLSRLESRGDEILIPSRPALWPT